MDGAEHTTAVDKTEKPSRRKEKNKDPASMHHEGSFAKYMEFKNLKLREQFDEQSMSAQCLTNIFEGVTIHVNGYTVPSHQELKQLMALHGGRFENYFSSHTVTHIICRNLPDTKLKQLAKQRKPLPIVKPEWVVASIKSGRLLPVADFLLDTTRLDVPGQSRLTAFTSHDVGHMEAQEMYPNLAATTSHPILPTDETAQPASALLQTAVLPGVQHGSSSTPAHVLPSHQASAWSAEGALPGSGTSPAPGPESAPTPASTGLATTPLPNPENPMLPSTAATPASSTPQITNQSKPVPSYTREQLHQAQQLAASLRAQCEVLRGGPARTTKDDPEFVNTFFKASRLHFIGTWKTRIEDLFSTAPQGPSPTPYPPDKAATTSNPTATFRHGKSSVHLPDRWVVHLDMDCFFASAALPGRPILRGVPLAVSHSNSAAGSGEVSTANYEARKYGVRSGMFISDAKKKCPDLVVVPYEFDRYQKISDQVYKILLGYSSCVQPISCDEAFMDITGLGDPEELVARIRADIIAATECPASAGIAPNMLLARLATGKAKPNGQMKLDAKDARKFLAELGVSDLPGVGWSMKTKLEEMGITQVQQLWGVSREMLQRQLGTKSGLSLWRYAQGLDDRRVEPPRARKSVGAEINYGIRMSQPEDLKEFMDKLVGEVCSRLVTARVKGRTITLKVKRRQVDAPEPLKFMGHGACDNISRSVTLSRFTNSAADVGREAMALLAGLQVPIAEIRGLGITVAKLDNDIASMNARPSAPAPAKVAAPPRGKFDPSKHTWWLPAPPKVVNESNTKESPHKVNPLQQLVEAATKGTAPDARQERCPEDQMNALEHATQGAPADVIEDGQRAEQKQAISAASKGALADGTWGCCQEVLREEQRNVDAVQDTAGREGALHGSWLLEQWSPDKSATKEVVAGGVNGGLSVEEKNINKIAGTEPRSYGLQGTQTDGVGQLGYSLNKAVLSEAAESAVTKQLVEVGNTPVFGDATPRQQMDSSVDLIEGKSRRVAADATTGNYTHLSDRAVAGGSEGAEAHQVRQTVSCSSLKQSAHMQRLPGLDAAACGGEVEMVTCSEDDGEAQAGRKLYKQDVAGTGRAETANALAPSAGPSEARQESTERVVAYEPAAAQTAARVAQPESTSGTARGKILLKRVALAGAGTEPRTRFEATHNVPSQKKMFAFPMAVPEHQSENGTSAPNGTCVGSDPFCSTNMHLRPGKHAKTETGTEGRAPMDVDYAGLGLGDTESDEEAVVGEGDCQDNNIQGKDGVNEGELHQQGGCGDKVDGSGHKSPVVLAASPCINTPAAVIQQQSHATGLPHMPAFTPPPPCISNGTDQAAVCGAQHPAVRIAGEAVNSPQYTSNRAVLAAGSAPPCPPVDRIAQAAVVAPQQDRDRTAVCGVKHNEEDSTEHGKMLVLDLHGPSASIGQDSAVAELASAQDDVYFPPAKRTKREHAEGGFGSPAKPLVAPASTLQKAGRPAPVPAASTRHQADRPAAAPAISTLQEADRCGAVPPTSNHHQTGRPVAVPATSNHHQTGRPVAVPPTSNHHQTGRPVAVPPALAHGQAGRSAATPPVSGGHQTDPPAAGGFCEQTPSRVVDGRRVGSGWTAPTTSIELHSAQEGSPLQANDVNATQHAPPQTTSFTRPPRPTEHARAVTYPGSNSPLQRSDCNHGQPACSNAVSNAPVQGESQVLPRPAQHKIGVPPITTTPATAMDGPAPQQHNNIPSAVAVPMQLNPLLEGKAAAAPSHAALSTLARQPGGVHHVGVAALPPASELDPEVLDQLPLDVKRELERAYNVRSLHELQHSTAFGAGMFSVGRTTRPVVAGGHPRGSGRRGAGAKRGAGAAGLGRPAAMPLDWLYNTKLKVKERVQQHDNPPLGLLATTAGPGMLWTGGRAPEPTICVGSDVQVIGHGNHTGRVADGAGTRVMGQSYGVHGAEEAPLVPSSTPKCQNAANYNLTSVHNKNAEGEAHLPSFAAKPANAATNACAAVVVDDAEPIVRHAGCSGLHAVTVSHDVCPSALQKGKQPLHAPQPGSADMPYGIIRRVGIAHDTLDAPHATGANAPQQHIRTSVQPTLVNNLQFRGCAAGPHPACADAVKNSNVSSQLAVAPQSVPAPPQHTLLDALPGTAPAGHGRGGRAIDNNRVGTGGRAAEPVTEGVAVLGMECVPVMATKPAQLHGSTAVPGVDGNAANTKISPHPASAAHVQAAPGLKAALGPTQHPAPAHNHQGHGRQASRAAANLNLLHEAARAGEQLEGCKRLHALGGHFAHAHAHTSERMCSPSVALDKQAHAQHMQAARELLFQGSSGQDIRQVVEQCVKAAAGSCLQQQPGCGRNGTSVVTRVSASSQPTSSCPHYRMDRASSEKAGGDGANDAGAVTMFQIAAEVAAQWAVGQLKCNLEEGRKVVVLLTKLSIRYNAFRSWARQAVDAIQAHTRDTFGFTFAVNTLPHLARHQA